MKILFLTLVNIENVNERNLYADLMRKFRDEGHEVYIVTPSERRQKRKTIVLNDNGITVLRVKIFNIQKTNLIEKGIATILIEHQFLKAIKKYFAGIKFDLILYSTPPITLTKVIRYIKKKTGAISYLLLKDIFPQNAVDLGMMKKRSMFYGYFRNKEKKLYSISDHIGCMSQANVDYLIRHNPDINPEVIKVNPNTIEPDLFFITNEDKISIRHRYGIPANVTVFIYGGNIGKPQGIDFLLEILHDNKDRKDIFFVIAGNGTEFLKVQSWFNSNIPANAKLLTTLKKSDYDRMIQSCDVGLIFLDKRFTIPNFPSRLLSYLEYKMPVIASTDVNTDMGKIIEENKFGLWCRSGDRNSMNNNLNSLLINDQTRLRMGENGYNFLINNYTVTHSYNIIMDSVCKNE